MCEIGRKREENRRKKGPFATNSPFSLVPFFHNLATPPSSSFDESCLPNWPTRKMGILGLADSRRFFGQRRWLLCSYRRRVLCRYCGGQWTAD